MTSTRHRRARSRAPLLVLVGLLVVVSAVFLTTELSRTSTQVTQVTAEKDTAVAAKVGLAETIGAACLSGTIPPQYALACTQAQQVKSEPVPGPPGPGGATGRGIISTTISAGHLILTYTDGSAADVGQVVGAAGALGPAGPLGPSGVPGPPGIPGAAGTNGANGHDGRGVVNAAIVSGHLVLTYSDGTQTDVGQVVGPAGPAGPPGPAGPAAVTPTAAPPTDTAVPPTSPVSAASNPTG